MSGGLEHEKAGGGAETWRVEGDGEGTGTPPLTAAEALHLLRARIAAGHLQTWLVSSEGRPLASVCHIERATV